MPRASAARRTSPMTKVHIEAFGHIVTVEADTDLDGVAAKALDLWQATRDQRPQSVPAAGFTTDRSGAQGNYTSGPDTQ